jgi:hypothetical protein
MLSKPCVRGRAERVAAHDASRGNVPENVRRLELPA